MCSDISAMRPWYQQQHLFASVAQSKGECVPEMALDTLPTGRLCLMCCPSMSCLEQHVIAKASQQHNRRLWCWQHAATPPQDAQHNAVASVAADNSIRFVQSLLVGIVDLQITLLLLNLGTEANLISSCSLQGIAMPVRQAMPQNFLLGSGNDLHGDEHIQCVIDTAANVLLIILSASWRS